MREPIQKVRRQLARSDLGAGLPASILKTGYWFSGSTLLPTIALVAFLDGAIRRVLRQPRGPRLVEPLLECAALVGPVLVVVAAVTTGQIPARCGGWPIAASICVAPTYEPLNMPTLPFECGSAAAHSTVS